MAREKEEIRIFLTFQSEALYSQSKNAEPAIPAKMTPFQHASEQIQTTLKYYTHLSRITLLSDKFENSSVSIFVVREAQCKVNYAFQYKKAAHPVHRISFFLYLSFT